MIIGEWIQLADVIISFIGTIGTVIGLGFIYKQYKIANEQVKESIEQTQAMNDQNTIQKNNIRRDKALQMSAYFMDLLDNEISVISNILSSLKIADIYKDKEYNELKEFDAEEAKGIFGKSIEDWNVIYDEIDDVKLIEISNTFLAINDLDKIEIKKILMFNAMKWDMNNCPKIVDENGSEPDECKCEDIKNELLMEMNMYRGKMIHYYLGTKAQLLNKLEYFAMHFTCKLADDRVVYQSLHQVYLSIVKELYGQIASRNIGDGKDKYYTNLIDLYNKWAEEDAEKKKRTISTNRTQQLKPNYDD